MVIRSSSHFKLSSSCEPLLPNHLLTQKSRVLLSPPRNFVRQDLYLQKRWRRVQYLANIFWTRWRHEYLNYINKRQKLTGKQRNIEVNDIVLISDENTARNEWRLARVVECYTSRDNLVRSVKLKLATSQLNKDGKQLSGPTYLIRPINKLIMLVKT